MQPLDVPASQQYGAFAVRPSQICPGPQGTCRLFRVNGLARLKGARRPTARNVIAEACIFFAGVGKRTGCRLCKRCGVKIVEDNEKISPSYIHGRTGDNIWNFE